MLKTASDFKISGVMARWNPKPKFYDISTGAFEDVEEVFVPFSLITEQFFDRSGNTNCWKPSESGFQAFLDSECIWTQVWVELPTEADRDAYQGFIDACPLYGEQISHHPPISSIFMAGRGYFISANLEAKINFGLNSAAGLN